MIGVFDSGVGGLTVLRALRAALPGENFLYLGDTARLPYGTKSAASVVRYSLQCAEALIARGIGCLVVACNTASASALDALRRRYPHIPVIGVIEPGAAAAVATSRSKHIVVIGTEGTIGGGAYQSAIHRLNPAVRVTAAACSLIVALAEEGWTEGPIAEAVARRYLTPLFSTDDVAEAEAAADGRGPDTLILGCTHFPVLEASIRAVLPAHVRIVDSAATVAAAVVRELTARGTADGPLTAAPSPAPSPALPATLPATLHPAPSATPAVRGTVTWLATDGAARFSRVSGIFLGGAVPVEQIEIIDL